MSQARKSARQALVQALYQWQMAKQDIEAIEKQFREEKSRSNLDFAYFSELLHAIPGQVSELDALIEPCLTRKMADINPVELSILRVATFELKNRVDIPYRVVINEAVELSKKFGVDQGHKFVNSVLDKLAQQLRSVEVNSRKSS